MRIRISHWLPLMTVCPVNGLPDLVYVTIQFDDQFQELYQVRKKIRKWYFRKLFMENLAAEVLSEFSTATKVTVSLMFNRHSVEIYR